MKLTKLQKIYSLILQKRTAEQMNKSPVLLNERCVSGAITQLPLEIVSQNVGNVNTSKVKKSKKCKNIHF